MNFINKRIERDIVVLRENNINFSIIDNKTLHCIISGPEDTPYFNGVWKIVITFPKEYPFKSPSIGFVNKIWHPNIDFISGSICIDVLNTNWSPIYTLAHIIQVFIPQLLTYPNPEDPLNEDCAKEYKENYENYIKKASSIGEFI